MGIFALVDCNNFYVSCERIFNPKLRHQPVIVLSNNDGCVVARSNEAKLLGIKMGEPYFKMKERLGSQRVIALSSNYSLYADISHRVMQILTEQCPDIEYYSIDEAFLKFDGLHDLEIFFTKLRQQVLQWVGIPVSIGIANTKVLAKVANHIAKKHTISGVKMLLNEEERDRWLEQIAIDELWGIGKRWALKLNQFGIITARQLQQCHAEKLKSQFNVCISRIIYELRGINCLDLENVAPKKSITCSRSFGKAVTSLQELREALTTYTSRACEKLRKQQGFTQHISVFIHTNPHKENQPQRAVSAQMKLSFATDSTLEILQAAQTLLKQLFRSGYQYQKVGILLLELQDQIGQADLFTINKPAHHKNMMPILDEINNRFGQDTLFIASAGSDKDWQMRRNQVSHHFTTQWQELLVVK